MASEYVTDGTMIPGDSDLTFRTATGELDKGGKRVHFASCDDWESNLRVSVVQTVVVCWRVHNDHNGSNVAKKIRIQKEFFATPRLHSCMQRKQREQHLHETERCHCLEIQNRGIAGRVQTGGAPDPEVPGDGHEAMVPREQTFLLSPVQIVEHELTGHAVCRRSCAFLTRHRLFLLWS